VLKIPVRELKERITVAEMRDWQMYFKIHGPSADRRADWQTATICCQIQQLINTLVNIHGGEIQEYPQPKDYLLEFKTEQETETEITPETFLEQQQKSLQRFLNKW
jgi:hypothetical protein